MKQKTKVTLGAVIVVAAIAALLISGMNISSGYEVALGDLTANGQAYADDYLVVTGNVVGSSVKFDSQQINLSFVVTDPEGKTQLPVVHNGVRPDNFEDGIQVILEGRYADGVFTAEKLQTKCPSKYEAESQ